MSTEIAIEATIVRYIPNAMRDEFDTGSFAVFDATVLRIQLPQELNGTEITIYHDNLVPETSFWRDIECQIRFQIQKDVLDSSDILFVGAIANPDIIGQN